MSEKPIYRSKFILIIVRDWFLLFRPPFHLVGIFPFLLGIALAKACGYSINWILFSLGLTVVMTVMGAAYLVGELFDYGVDVLSARLERNVFSGGTQVLQKQTISPKSIPPVIVIILLISTAAGAYILWYTGDLWLLGMGIFGVICGIGYSLPPFRWAWRGIGEILIAVCYGWLPVACAYLIQTGTFSPLIFYLAIPTSLTIFSVILINEIPDFPADIQFHKRNLCVRLGRQGSAYLYSALSILTALSMVFIAVIFINPPHFLWLVFAAFIILCLFLAFCMLAGKWKDPRRLKYLCALTIVKNLSASAIVAISLLIG